MRILAASDIHIGRIPSLPSDANACITGRSAWEAVVQCAMDQRVQVVLLAGDVVEGDSAWFEAYGPLKKGLARLRDKGIKVLAVAGNHDAKVFPDLAEDSAALTILGLGGRWQTHDLGPIRVMGWSFPSVSYQGNPMDTFPEDVIADGKPYLGLLHCDLDGPATSHYAPVPAHTLEMTGAAAWILGHIHLGEFRVGNKGFYCGSPFALDAGEEGEHGVWLMDVDDHGSLTRVEPLALSPWIFKTLSVDMDGVTTFEGARNRIAETAQRWAPDVFGGSGRTVFFSLALHGATILTGSLRSLFQERLLELELSHGDTAVRFTGRIADSTRPPLEVAEIAKGKGIRASLARIVLQAENPTADIDEVPALVAQVMPFLRTMITDPDEASEAARTTLGAAARSLLMTIEDQRRKA